MDLFVAGMPGFLFQRRPANRVVDVSGIYAKTQLLTITGGE
jgi:hypothetical protein